MIQFRRNSGFGVRALALKSAVLAKARTPNLSAAVAVFLLFALHPQTAHACAVCFGKSDSAMAKGMNMGIFALLICIGAVLATLSTFFIFLAVRSSKHPHRDAMGAALNSSENPAHS
jgi:hypothetical protein